MLPTNVSTGRVEGRFIVGVQDGPDPDDVPDFVAAQGTIEFTASASYLPNPTAVPAPVTLLKTAIRGVLDAEGYLCAMNADGSPGVRGLRLVATDDPDLLVQNWTWSVTYRFTPVNGSTPSIAAHAIALPSETTVDLTTAMKVPASPGVGLPQSEAAVLRAEAAATDSAQSSAAAESAALDVVTRANSGEFKGDQGLPGNATMRIDTTVGTRVFITNGVTERMVSGDTGNRNISTLMPAGVVQSISVNAPRPPYIRRVDSTVFLTMYLDVNEAGITTLVTVVPPGFRPHSLISKPGRLSIDSSGAGRPLPLTDTNWYLSQASVRTAAALPSPSTVMLDASWATPDTWPTTLPGSPA